MKPLILVLASLIGGPLAAQTPNCAPREALITKLTNVGEAQAAIGLDTKGSLLEIWASDATGTWTVVMSFSTGVSCIMTHGQNWAGPVTVALDPKVEPVKVGYIRENRPLFTPI
jgi:hypothetical protein